MKLQDRNPFLLGIVALCALGVGITGTLLWKQEQAPAATVVATSAAPTAAAPTVPVQTGSMQQTGRMEPSAQESSSAEAALAMGNQFYDSQQWPQAIQKYRQVIASGFDSPNVRTDLGNALRFNGQPQEALEQYIIAQSQDPSHEQSLFNQGGLWAFSLNNPTKGIQAWREYLKRFPKGMSAQDARKFIKEQESKAKTAKPSRK